jgi:hypothetical protein
VSRLLRSRAWSILALLAGVASVWAGDILWLRLACAAGLVTGIAQQLTLLGPTAACRIPPPRSPQLMSFSERMLR